MSEQRYLVTARKYRPNRFSELVAQEHVTETLKNALRLDRLAHAYLFSGPRGVGKTTAARILAKAINCTAPEEERTDGAEPCRQCASCQDFESGRSLSIFEIDAASNNKVDDIRDLRETVRVPPQGARKKVYIIDEVHMLSTAAFNALLKTLEEPPPHVLFIFATTEPHKVLPTILSRCQRFDFRRIPVPDVVTHLQGICAEENITADEASLMLLARKGDGALRDALSAFDQALALCGTDLRYPDLADALRVVDVDLFFEVTAHVQAHSSAGMLRLVERIVRAGYDLQEFLVGLAEHLRNLLVAHTTEATTLIEAPEATRQRYAEAASGFDEAGLLRLLTLVDEAEEAIKSSTQPRLKLEMALLKMAALAHTTDLRRALAQLDGLEKMAREGTLPAGLAAAPAPAPAAPKTEKPAPPVVREPAPAPPFEPSPAAKASPAEAPPAEIVREERAPVEENVAPEAAAPVVATGQEEAPPWEEAIPAEAAAPSEEAAPRLLEEPPAAPEEAAPEETAAAAEEPPAPTEEPPPSPAMPSLFPTPALQRKPPHDTAPEDAGQSALFAGSSTTTAPEARLPAFDDVANAWPRYVQAVKSERIHVGALLQHTAPLAVESEALVIGVPDDFHRRLLQSQREFLLEHLRLFAPPDVGALSFTVHETLDTSTAEEESTEIDPKKYFEQKRRDNPVIRALFDQFGGELVW